MNLLPPKHLLEQWREAGLSPEQIYQKCREMSKDWGSLFQGQPRDDDMVDCEACQNKPVGRGLCRKHYNRLMNRVKRERQQEKPQEGAEVSG